MTILLFILALIIAAPTFGDIFLGAHTCMYVFSALLECGAYIHPLFVFGDGLLGMKGATIFTRSL